VVTHDLDIPASIRAVTCSLSRSLSANVAYEASVASSASSPTVRTRERVTGSRRPPRVTEPRSML
jgi:hypothetical protein